MLSKVNPQRICNSVVDTKNKLQKRNFQNLRTDDFPELKIKEANQLII